MPKTKATLIRAICEGGRGQGRRSNVPDHERVDQAHQHLADLSGHNRASERQRFDKFCRETSGVRHRPFTKSGFQPLASPQRAPVGWSWRIHPAFAFEQRRFHIRG